MKVIHLEHQLGKLIYFVDYQISLISFLKSINLEIIMI